MTKSAIFWRIPWAVVLTVALLAGGVAVRARFGPEMGEAVPWTVLGSIMVTVGAAFLAMRWLQNYFWGVTAGVLLIMHPLVWAWAGSQGELAGPEGQEVVMLAVAIVGWRLVFRLPFAFGWRLVLAILLIVGAMPLLTMIPERFTGLSWHGFDLETFSSSLRSVFQREQMDRWCWPHMWTVIALLIWGLWRSVWRGWREQKMKRPPTAWLLTLYSGITMAGVGMRPEENLATRLLPLTPMAVLLCVFGIADVFRGISERLVLLPPGERQEGR